MILTAFPVKGREGVTELFLLNLQGKGTVPLLFSFSLTANITHSIIVIDRLAGRNQTEGNCAPGWAGV